MADELVAEICRPLSAESPAGEDARYEPEYAELTDMIEKLSSVTQDGFDWHVVRDRAVDVLKAKSKDFQAATYLAIALLHTDGLQGAVDGVRILNGLVAGFWETGFPVLKRLRGRINAFNWWKERLLVYLEEYPADQPASFALYTGLGEALSELDSALGTALPDFPPLREIIEAAGRLPSEAEPEPEPETAPEPKPEPLSEEAQASAPSAPDPKPEPAFQPVQPAPEPEPVQPAAKPAASAPAPAPEAPSEDAQATRRSLLRSLADFADWGRTQAPADPLFWQAGCLACWGGIGQLPPNETGVTMVPEPDPYPTEAVLALVHANDIAGAARLAMESLAAAPLALDLAHLAHMTLKELGAQYAPCALAVEACCMSLLHRLPGLERLQFSSGRPLAGAKTQAWLASLVQGSGQGKAESRPSRDPAIVEAESLAAEGSLARALDLLDEAMAKAPGMEVKCSLRIAQARLLAQAEQWNAASALAEEFCQTFAEGSPLAAWHPQLACDALKAAARIWEGAGGERGMTRTSETLRRLAAIRPSQALRGLT